MSQGGPPCSSLLSHSLPVCLPSDQHPLNARWNKRSAWSEGVAKNAKRQTQGFVFLPRSCLLPASGAGAASAKRLEAQWERAFHLAHAQPKDVAAA
jgi:hypothetical protein